MDKIRVYELARDLDTNSKRLMEKLAEIGIIVKNHMSLLEENELESLYKHIGMKAKTQDTVQPSASQPPHEPAKPAQNAVEAKPVKSEPEEKKDVRDAPRIREAKPGTAAGSGAGTAAGTTVGTGAGTGPSPSPGTTAASRTAAGTGPSPSQGTTAASRTGAGTGPSPSPGATAASRTAAGARAGAAAVPKDTAGAAKGTRNAPRIIRTTEINLDRAAREEKRENVRQPAAGTRPGAGREGDRGRRGGRDHDRDRRRRDYDRSEYYRAPDSNSGLIAGFTRMTREENMKQLLAEARANQKKAVAVSDEKREQPAPDIRSATTVKQSEEAAKTERAARIDRLARIDASVMADISVTPEAQDAAKGAADAGAAASPARVAGGAAAQQPGLSGEALSAAGVVSAVSATGAASAAEAGLTGDTRIPTGAEQDQDRAGAKQKAGRTAGQESGRPAGITDADSAGAQETPGQTAVQAAVSDTGAQVKAQTGTQDIPQADRDIVILKPSITAADKAPAATPDRAAIAAPERAATAAPVAATDAGRAAERPAGAERPAHVEGVRPRPAGADRPEHRAGPRPGAPERAGARPADGVRGSAPEGMRGSPSDGARMRPADGVRSGPSEGMRGGPVDGARMRPAARPGQAPLSGAAQRGGAPSGAAAPARPGGQRPQDGRSQPRASFDGRPYQQQDQNRTGQGMRSRPQDGRPYQQQGAYQQQGQFGPRRDGRPAGATGDRPFRPREDRPGSFGGDRQYQPRDGAGRQYAAQGGARQGTGPRTGTAIGGDRRPQGAGRPRTDFNKPTGFTRSDETGSLKNEQKREHSGRDTAKEAKKDLRRDSAKPAPATATKNRRFKPQVSIIGEKKGVQAFTDDEFIINEFYDTSTDESKRNKRQQRQRKGLRKEKYIPPRAILTSVTIAEILTVKELAEALKKTASDVISKLMGFGMVATINETLDFDTATLVAAEFGIAAEKEIVVNEEDILFDDSDAEDEGLVSRPPIVVVMGHVDHGKTSLLDAIRKTNVISSEAGGITQHIGAYTVNINNRAITFLDTPGHEAFTSMRARGAMVTDIAILVISAVDGVMPQTVEAINHAKAANVSMIIAINMMDREGANPDRVKQELTEHEILVEEWGGEVIAVPVSAKTGENIEQLLEMVILTADMLELKANPGRQAKGTVIEAKLDRNRGPVATLLVQRGTLNVGDSFITGSTVGRIRAMLDDKGNSIQQAGPSMPVEIIGLSEVPEAGVVFYVTTDDKVTKSLAEKRRQMQREEQLRATTSRITLDDLFSQIKEGKVKELNLIIKADVQGSVEAVRQSVEKLGNDEVRVNIIHSGVGAINESDVSLASVSNAIIIGFNVRPGGASVIEAADIAGIDVRLYTVIYNAIEDIQAAMKGMLDPTYREVVLGHVEVRQIFRASGVGTIGGCYVLDGKIQRSNNVRILRDGISIFDGRLASLRRFKDDAREVMQGFECGIAIDRFNDIKENDIIEPYMMEEIPVV